MTSTKQQRASIHATIDGKRTICGLSDEYKLAHTLDKFKNLINDGYSCCKKCEIKLNK